jgi:hypothetical protein
MLFLNSLRSATHPREGVWGGESFLGIFLQIPIYFLEKESYNRSTVQ